MDNKEHTLMKTSGRFALAVSGGQQVDKISWLEGNILLSNKNIHLIGDDSRISVSLSNITMISDDNDSAQSIAVFSNDMRKYVRVGFENNVVIVSSTNHGEFIEELYKAAIGGNKIKCKHPVAKGGVIKDPSWKSARLSVEKDRLIITLSDGTQVIFRIDEVSTWSTKRERIQGGMRELVSVSIVRQNSTVKTHITAPKQTCFFIKSFLRQFNQHDQVDTNLTATEEEVLLAVHSGISPFNIPNFVDHDVETVEEIFDRLVEHGIIDRVRMRQEVEINACGNRIAENAVSDR